jgi:hypothetical protein
MRLRIHIERTAEGRWTLYYPDAVPFEPVELERVAKGAYPVMKRVGAVFDEAALAALAARLAAKQVRDGEVVEGFGRHLFQVLIGESLWGQLPGGPPCAIELLCTDPEFTRLPWEIMHGPRGFLAKGGIAVIRIAPANSGETSVTVRPRVLFVVGAELHDPRIRAGAEYLGLLRRLENTGLVMESHLLTRATRARLGDSIKGLRPSIVHFVCHGGLEPGLGGYLELTSEDPTKPYDKVPARQLTELLDPLPQVVVMNACHSGAASPDTAPLALEVLTSGVPVVIGMSGRVADRACRLFTRRFYEALLEDQPIDQATAAARRTGMQEGADPYRSVDWGMPMLFLRDKVRVELDRSEAACLRTRAARAKIFRALTNPMVLCGRIECLTGYETLLDGCRTDCPQVLALKVAEREAALPNPQYGKTRLLEEMAAMAAVRGHLPCLVRFPREQAPKTPWALAWRILAAIARTREEFGLVKPLGDSELSKLDDLQAKPANELSLDQWVVNQLKLERVAGPTPAEQLPASVVRTALMTDLLALAADARNGDAAPDAKAVVLIDDVHLCGEAARSLVETWANPHGLGRKDDPVPLVIAYSALAEEIYKADIEFIGNFMEQRPAVFASLPLKAFPSPLEDELPYQQLFLAQAPMLVVKGDLKPEERSGLYQVLHEDVRGVPSRFASRPDDASVQMFIKTARALGALVEADDDKVLALKAGASG